MRGREEREKKLGFRGRKGVMVKEKKREEKKNKRNCRVWVIQIFGLIY